MKKKFLAALLFASIIFISCDYTEDNSNQGVELTETNIFTDPKTGEEYQLNPNWKIMEDSDSNSLNKSQSLSSSKINGVEIKIWQSRSDYRQHNSVKCDVGADYVCIGGGAYADYGSGSGALLTESKPCDDFSGWTGSSKDHKYKNEHYLYVYAIGLKLDNVDKYTLINQLQIVENTSVSMQHPNTGVTLPDGFKLIGGGARVNWSGAGNLLTASYPSGNTWNASSKDHSTVSYATITAYAIGIRQNIPGFGFLRIEQQSKTGQEVSTGVASNNITVTESYLLACPGANSVYNYYGRLLTAIIPKATSMTTYTKDHRDREKGSVDAYAVIIKRN